MAEIIVRFVFQVVLIGLLELIGAVGRFIARPIVAFIGGGRVLLDPPPGNLIVVRHWHGPHRLTDGTPVIGKAPASLLGLSIAIAALILLLVAWRFAR